MDIITFIKTPKRNVILVNMYFVLASWFIVGQPNITKNDEASIPSKFYEQAGLFPEFCIIKGKDSLKQIALTFDDGPSLTSKKILDILETYDGKATFFWLGSNMADHLDIVNLAIKNGHLVANHSWDHPNMGSFTSQRFWQEQVNRTNQEIENLTGYKITYYRPPFGNISNEQIQFLKEKNIKTVLWSFSTIDWSSSKNSFDQITNRIENNMFPGAIILFHDFDPKDNRDAGSSRKGMFLALESIIKKYKALNYKFVTVDQLLSSN